MLEAPALLWPPQTRALFVYEVLKLRIIVYCLLIESHPALTVEVVPAIFCYKTVFRSVCMINRESVGYFIW